MDPTGAIRGKPADLNEAIDNAQGWLEGLNNTCGTAFCVDKKIYKDGSWQVHQRIMKYAQATYEVDVPDQWIEKYIQDTGALEAAGAIKIEDGAQFIKSVSGSYTAIVGLPMYELWQALSELGFF